ncbi:Retrovirus-related Pol polyprotein from transposon 297 [Vitis vinifera]|uniref:Retrovirus-related Pol polyprotein from transposon 297 n=1 Tax=Vitis vinifera TaxID=29760 RepID=A0A438FTE8_VITVI|nr:Retrovirus-related Pol polyprotein from transposon 297 [Vitis vinifera]
MSMLRNSVRLCLRYPTWPRRSYWFNFMDNLQSWVEQELRRHGVQDLATTMAVVESFVDYRRGDSSKPKPPSKGNQAKGKDKRKEFTPKTNCFLCDGPHWAWDCPKRKALNAMIEEKEQEGDAKVGSLQLLNALKAKLMPKMPQSKGLMYMEALVNGKATKALVDTGATHNFVSENEARRLELQASKEGGWLKAINSATKPSHGVARGMTMHIGSWEGRVDFIVAPMDDFKMVLRMDFLQRVKAVPLPFLRSMAILEEKKPCMVPTVTKGTLKTPMLSAMQVMKGLKRKEVTYLTTLKEERNDGSGEPMPKEIEGVLDEFKDMMPPELLKRFPPRMEEDHKIELELLTGAPILFQKKHDGSLRMCIDYRALNKGKVLHEARSKVRLLPSKDCGGGRAEDYMCDQVRLIRVLSDAFRLTNAPTTFCTLMNKIFHPYLDKFMVVYLDDIVIYSNTLKEHVEYLRKVFKISRQNELHVKNEKCSFAKEEVSFLGHRNQRWAKLMMDGSKVKAIQEWDPPTKSQAKRCGEALHGARKGDDCHRSLLAHLEALSYGVSLHKVGDMVLVKLLPQQFKSLRPVHKGLMRRYKGPFPILGKVSKVSYRVKMPPRLKIHPVFHVSYLKPYHKENDDPSRGLSKRAPIRSWTSYDKEVEHILADRVIRRRGVPPATEYLVKWKGRPKSEASWVPADALWQFQEQIELFRAESATRTSAA